MKAVNYSELRTKLKENLDIVCDNDDLLLVQRPKGRSVVMMSLSEYNGLLETMHLTKSKANRQRLDSSVENINKRTNLVRHNIVD